MIQSVWSEYTWWNIRFWPWTVKASRWRRDDKILRIGGVLIRLTACRWPVKNHRSEWSITIYIYIYTTYISKTIDLENGVSLNSIIIVPRSSMLRDFKHVHSVDVIKVCEKTVKKIFVDLPVTVSVDDNTYIYYPSTNWNRIPVTAVTQQFQDVSFTKEMLQALIIQKS